MSQMIHFRKWSLVRGRVHVAMNLTAYGERLETAQWWLGNQVLQGCRALMPLLTGSLQDRSHVEDGGRRVVFPGPSARYLYMGKVMVDAKTGKGPMKIPTGPGEYVLRFRKGAKLAPTNRRLTYSNPEGNLPHWVNGVENIIKTGRP